MQVPAADNSAVYLLQKAPPPDDRDKRNLSFTLGTLMQPAHANSQRAQR
jgi:hypothetical protein